MSDQYFQYYHGSPEGPLTHYLRNERLAARALDAISSSRLAVGHTHQPSFYHSRNETVRGKSIRGSETIRGISTSEEIVVNPGSVGQPRDGDPRAAYLLVEEHKDERMDLSWRRIEYDIKKVQERILDAGLPQPLASRLSRGK